jgi:hypothetical protein
MPNALGKDHVSNFGHSQGPLAAHPQPPVRIAKNPIQIFDKGQSGNGNVRDDRAAG